MKILRSKKRMCPRNRGCVVALHEKKCVSNLIYVIHVVYFTIHCAM
jgi:hypothetical protein